MLLLLRIIPRSVLAVMTESTASRPSAPAYPDWKAPAEDGTLLIWPEPTELLRDTRENQRRLSAANNILIQNVPLPEVRKRQREWLGHRDDAQPIVATGHQ